MGKLKKGVAVVGGIAFGLVTLRSLRKWRASNDEEFDEIEEDVEEAQAGLETATEHAIAAAEHTGAAAKKAIEARREKAQ